MPGTLDGRTIHIVCIAEPTIGYSAIYTNGVLESEVTGSLPPLSGVSTSFSYLGRSLFSTDAWLNGSIDEFRIYHGRLTPEEIAANFIAGPDALAIPVALAASNSPTGLAFMWPTFAVGFTLESSVSLGMSAVWNPVQQTPTLDGGYYSLIVPAASEAQYYRLKR